MQDIVIWLLKVSNFFMEPLSPWAAPTACLEGSQAGVTRYSLLYLEFFHITPISIYCYLNNIKIVIFVTEFLILRIHTLKRPVQAGKENEDS
jgi:hypothetical protein